MATRSGYIGRSPGDDGVIISRQVFNVTSDTSTFTFLSQYTPGYLDIYLNGTKLVEGSDYTATDGSTFILNTFAVNGDVIEAIAQKVQNFGNPVEDLTNLTVSNDVTVGRNVSASGFVTATNYYGDGSSLTGLPQQGVGIQSGGAVVGYAVTTLNFIGVGNTFKLSGSTVDISIQGGGGGGGIGATSGIATYSLYSNQSVLTGGDYQLVNQDESGAGYNYGAFGPITVSTGSTIFVGEFDEFVII